MSGPVGSSTWFGTSGYNLNQSLRFDRTRDCSLSKTFASAGNRRTFTISLWMKSTETSTGYIFEGGDDDSDGSRAFLRLEAGAFRFAESAGQEFTTAAIRRDPAAWYHVVLAVDTTQGTNTNRIKFYINGEAQTFSTINYPGQNHDYGINKAALHTIGRSHIDDNNPINAYFAEYHFLDGSALGPENFGLTNEHGAWGPKEFAGAHGTNGFYLPFKADYTVEGFSAVTYRGNNIAGLYIGGVGFQPDFVWTKKRNGSNSHRLVDAVRGVTKTLSTDTADAQATENTVTSFETDGFTVGAGNSNNDAGTYVAYNWDMGGSNATLTAGSINSVVRASTTYGQSIVSYTGNAASSATIAHGLSSAPEMIIVRQLGANAWAVYHTSIGNTHLLELNTNAAKADNDQFWNDTSPTSSVFTIGSHAEVNPNGVAVIAYAFHSVTGYSKFAGYTGTGASNAITTGFAPAFLIIKRADGGTGGWMMYDSVRGASQQVQAQVPDAEDTVAGKISFQSTGFTCVIDHAETNSDGDNYIYMAFADKREYAYWLDLSGNNNDWTSNNLTESDISVDSPTNNFATLNPLNADTEALREGNLLIKSRVDGSGNGFSKSTIAIPKTGKWYAEYLYSSGNIGAGIGIALASVGAGSATGNYYFPAVSKKYTISGTTYSDQGSYGAGWNVGTIIGIAMDSDNTQITFYKNNATQNVAFTGLNDEYVFANATVGGAVNEGVWNFGQDSSFAGFKASQGNLDGNGEGDFYYAPPSGFLALCTNNLPEPAVVPREHFNTVLYEGNGSTQDIAVGFQPDLTWIKNRDANDSHALVDSIRGVTEELTPDTNAAEVANDDGLTAFITTGFSLGDDVKYNTNNESYVSWNWKAGATELGTGDFTQGSIASTCRRNVEAGFSIVEYTGTQENATVGHGLSKAPDFVFMNHRNSTGGWATFNSGLGPTVNLDISTTGGTNDEAEIFQDTAPSATVVTIGNTTYNNKDDEIYVMYSFHDVDGFSKFGVYTGNGAADNAFVYTGFRPAFVYIKSVTNTLPWMMWDTERDPDNPVINYLLSEANNVEANAVASNTIDILSNGFKIRTAAADMGTAVVHAYVAFAETPLKYSNGR